jgi:hypothetical protein
MKSDRQKESDNDLVFSYLALRNLIGFSGILLPLLLVLTTGRAENDKLIELSISDYYYSSNGDVLVVVLSVLGVFLFTYNGYTWQEKLLTTLAAVCGICIAFSPTATHNPNSLSIHLTRAIVPKVFGVERHFIYAGIFFISLAIISLQYFPRSDQRLIKAKTGKRTQKAKRNRVYKVCGWTIVGCVILLSVYFAIEPLPALQNFPVVFVLETIAVEAFGISWITKGETLWPDGKHYLVWAYEKTKEVISH